MSVNPKTSLGILTMAAPIVLLGAVCTVATVWFSFAQDNQIHHSGKTETTICTTTLYLQIYNGVCTRGVVNGINPAASCVEWANKALWSAIDAANAAGVHGSVKDASKYAITDTVGELPSWEAVKSLCILTIPLSIINFVLCLVTSDIEIELWDIDFDKWTLVLCSVFNVLIIIAFIIAIVTTQNSEITNKKTWTSYDDLYGVTCTSAAAPSFGYFLMILGGFFALISLYISSYCIVRAYIWPLKDEDGKLLSGNFTSVKGNDVVPSFDEKDDVDDEDPRAMPMIQLPPSGSRPSSANQVAPAPSDNFSGVVLG